MQEYEVRVYSKCELKSDTDMNEKEIHNKIKTHFKEWEARFRIFY